MDLRIRAATVLDAPAAARVQAAVWREAYAGVVPDAVLAAQESEGSLAGVASSWAHAIGEEGASFWLVVDADAHGEVVGVANAMPARDVGAPALLELTTMVLRESAQGSGVAAALLEYAVGDADCYLWVPRESPRAQAFFRGHGFVADGVERAASTPLGDLTEIRLVRLSADDE